MFIGFFVWDNLTDTAQGLVIPAANDGGIYPLSRMTGPLFRREATETFCASCPRITAVLLFPATNSTNASSSASCKGCWKSLHSVSGNRGTAAINMIETPFRFWVHLFIGFFVRDNLTDTAQGLVIPAANDGGIYPLSRVTGPLFHHEATEKFSVSWSRTTAVVLFPVTKSTGASSTASSKSCWKILHSISGNGGTAAVNMNETPFRFWVHLFISFFVWYNLTDTVRVLVIPAAKDGGINSLSRMTGPLFCREATETFCASWPCITVVLLFPATKATYTSSSASLKGCWKILRSTGGIGGTAAVNMIETPFRFWVRVNTAPQLHCKKSKNVWLLVLPVPQIMCQLT
ncbi:hypothetical protein MRX96_059362 [Rhipicephalus microplus]